MKPEIASRQSTRLAHTQAYFSSPDAAPTRNFTQEMLQTLRGFQQTAPGYLDLERQFQPEYGRLALERQGQNMFGFTDDGVHTPGTLELGQAGARFQREGDIRDVRDLGPLATEAFLRSNPLLAGSLRNLSGRTNDSAILSTLNRQANEGLASGGALSPQEARAADQQQRAIYADRGTSQGNQSAVAQILNRDALTRQRRQAAEQFAGNVQGMNQNQNDFVGRASQIFSTTLNDPFQSILNRSSGAGGNPGGGGYQQQIGTGARIFDPMNPYAQDIYNTNFNARNAQNIQDANAQNANTSAVVSSIGSIIGGLLASDERLKKKVKPTGEKTKDGIPLKEFQYTTDPKKKPTRWRGVMAQDVEKVKPEHVRTDPVSGVKMVDYWGLGMPMMEVAA